MNRSFDAIIIGAGQAGPFLRPQGVSEYLRMEVFLDVECQGVLHTT